MGLIKVSKDELIARQSLHIAELEEEVFHMKASIDSVYGMFYNIGAPLNDNNLQFNRKQILYLLKIAKELGF